MGGGKHKILTNVEYSEPFELFWIPDVGGLQKKLKSDKDGGMFETDLSDTKNEQANAKPPHI